MEKRSGGLRHTHTKLGSGSPSRDGGGGAGGGGKANVLTAIAKEVGGARGRETRG